VASLLDSAMTHCLFHHGVQGLTGDLHIRFVRPVSCDVAVDIRAWILSVAGPLYRLRAELLHDRWLMAWAEGKFMQRKKG
jgi:acyl-coenzyme A thioesterase PaaI-like protein